MVGYSWGLDTDTVASKSLRIAVPPSPSTVNSKAEVRFHLASADWIEEPVRQKIALMVPTPFLSL